VGHARLDDPAQQANDDDGSTALTAGRPQTGSKGDVGLDSVDGGRPHGRVRVGEGEPLFAPGLTGAYGRDLQAMVRYDAQQVAGIDQPGIADGQLYAIVTHASDLGDVGFKIPLESHRLKLGRVRGQDYAKLHMETPSKKARHKTGHKTS
jgi:hypothetical protein